MPDLSNTTLAILAVAVINRMAIALHLKTEGKPALFMIGLDNEKSEPYKIADTLAGVRYQLHGIFISNRRHRALGYFDSAFAWCFVNYQSYLSTCIRNYNLGFRLSSHILYSPGFL